ncbi:hypothetical protein EMCG_07374 [[Emmonsia] crescens]|uniref:Uncharacterized protein n=1 Tax=[Emmonsia] crescens TaxID=73230 RepID=A0A0G2JB66_9EURO|nr:hypothetical protein EMCG_07374 [Emmonsia crescens UAMH 3008]
MVRPCIRINGSGWCQICSRATQIQGAGTYPWVESRQAYAKRMGPYQDGLGCYLQYSVVEELNGNPPVAALP